MPPRLLPFRLSLLAFLAWVTSAFAQTNPVPQPLPYSQDFGTAAFTTPPAGIGAWNGLSGGTLSSEAAAAGSAPNGDASISAQTAATTTGGSFGLANGGNARFYIQTSSNATNGANQLALALNTTGAGLVNLAYDVEIISAQPRTIGVLCQYRVGTSGAWATLSPTNAGLNPYSQAAGTAGVKTSVQVTLPPAAANVPVVQIRWATWRGTESGNSSGVAIDNIVASSGVLPPSLSASVTPGTVSEGAGANAATLTVTRTGDTASAATVTLQVSDLSEAAYDGPNPFPIPAGQASASIPLRAVDDDGGDGTQNVTLTVSSAGYTGASTSLAVTDNEDSFSPAVGYYDAANNLNGNALKAALKIIASPANYNAYSYANTYNPLRAIYEDPANTANVLLVYSGTSLGKTVNYFPGGPSADSSWSREHVWPDSYGLDPDNVNPGSTGGDAGPDFTDLFNLRPCLQTLNNQRSNRIYDFTSGTPTIPALAPQCSYDTDSWQARPEERGDLARSILYMATRYDGTDANTVDLEVAETSAIGQFRFAKLSTLLRWHEEDPVSLEERGRNQLIFTTYQRNRNPFIDHPEFAARIWGTVSQSKLAAAVAEGGATDSYTLRLGSQPTADVTIALGTSPGGQVTASPASVTFTSANWDQPQTVTLTAVNDLVEEATTLTTRIQHSLTSSDTRYAALAPLDIVITVTDNDIGPPPGGLPLTFDGPWTSLPTGFSSTGLGSPYDSDLGTDTNTGSAKFDHAGDRLGISFDSAPATLTYRLKANPSSGSTAVGTFLVQYSTNGTNFTTLRTVIDKDNIDQEFTDALPSTARHVAFVYSLKTSGNIQLDKVAITAAPPTPFQSWAASYGLSGNDAALLFDFDRDGLFNLAEYGLGHSPAAGDAPSTQPVVAVVDGKLRLTAVVRSDDAALTVTAQRTSDLSLPNSWTTAGITQIQPVNQSGVPAGFTRVTFEVDSAAPTRTFLRLSFTLN